MKRWIDKKTFCDGFTTVTFGIDIHKQEIYKIETGKRTVVDYELCGFAKVFNIKLEDLVSEYYGKL